MAKKKGCISGTIGIVAVIAIVCAIAGSGGKDDSSSKSDGKVSVSSNSSSAEKVSVGNSGNSEEEIKEEVNEVVFDDGGIKITYTGYKAAKLFESASFTFIIENNSDKNITVENFNFNVNGYTLDTWFYEDVPAGKKSNAEMSVSSSQLSDNGIEAIGAVDFSLRGINSDSYEEIFVTDSINIVFDESLAQAEDVNNYQQVYESDGVAVYFKDCDQSGSFETAKFNFLVVNDSDKNVTVSADNMSVNDFAMTDLFHADCAPGKKTNESISVYSTDLEKNNIDKIEKLEFSLRCYDSDSYQDIWSTDPITITIG